MNKLSRATPAMWAGSEAARENLQASGRLTRDDGAATYFKNPSSFSKSRIVA